MLIANFRSLAARACAGAILCSAAAAHADTMFWDDYLFAGQSLSSESCYYHLDMQSDGNLVLYSRYTDALWSSGTYGSGAYAVMQSDGNLVVYAWNGEAVWSSGTWGSPWSALKMQTDGNLVIYDNEGYAVWSSDTWTTESLGISPCPAPTSIMQIDHDFNRLGGDYITYEIDHNWPEACAHWCAQDARCKAFTHVPAGVQGPNAMCWLKDTVPPLTRAPGMASGRIRYR